MNGVPASRADKYSFTNICALLDKPDAQNLASLELAFMAEPMSFDAWRRKDGR
jgi:hypothetical protein